MEREKLCPDSDFRQHRQSQLVSAHDAEEACSIPGEFSTPRNSDSRFDSVETGKPAPTEQVGDKHRNEQRAELEQMAREAGSGADAVYNRSQSTMNWPLLVVALIGLYCLHRLLLWMETRGWIYYIHKRASPNTLGNAFLSVQQLVQPGTKHVLEVRQNERVQQDDAGGPDSTGDKPAQP